MDPVIYTIKDAGKMLSESLAEYAREGEWEMVEELTDDLKELKELENRGIEYVRITECPMSGSGILMSPRKNIKAYANDLIDAINSHPDTPQEVKEKAEYLYQMATELDTYETKTEKGEL